MGLMQVASVFNVIGGDDGRITREEFVGGFLRWWRAASSHLATETDMTTETHLLDVQSERYKVLRALFDEVDETKDGFIALPALKKLLGALNAHHGAGIDLEGDAAQRILEHFDENGDGSISAEEFCAGFDAFINKQMREAQAAGNLKSKRVLPPVDEERAAVLRELFAQFDEDNSGSLDMLEVSELLSTIQNDFNVQLGQGLEFAMQVFNEFDTNADGLVSEEEFVLAFDIWFKSAKKEAKAKRKAEKKGKKKANPASAAGDPEDPESVLRMLFRSHDFDKSGFLDDLEISELLKMLKEVHGLDIGLGAAQVSAVIADMDANGDGRLSEQEFVSAFAKFWKKVAK